MISMIGRQMNQSSSQGCFRSHSSQKLVSVDLTLHECHAGLVGNLLSDSEANGRCSPHDHTLLGLASAHEI